ncbi:YeeE/YedE family protein [Aestuariispira insulae]|nr:YeeE/YedE family protein [Aestuariispira insulae]
MTDHASPKSLPRAVQRPVFLTALSAALILFGLSVQVGAKTASLFLLGIGLGFSLYHAAFGFTSAYRRAFQEKDISGISAQFIMLALAMLLFAPVLANGSFLGNPVTGAVAPIGISMIFGAMIFGIGMQLGGGCGSGTLFTAGGGNIRMMIVLLFFCIGGFRGSLDLSWWQEMPRLRTISLAEELGWPLAVSMQLSFLVICYHLLRKLGSSNKRPLWWGGKFHWQMLIKGPWPLLLSAILLALFNWLTLLIAGHPWSITWAFALWAAKIAEMVGWDSATSAFWASGFPARALANSVFQDTTSIMNFGIMAGAGLAASLAGSFRPTVRIHVRSLFAAALGGLMLGYGARLAYGCNIGAFFSGVASTSLHGWAWIIAALVGNFIGLRLRPLFRQS